MADDLRFQEYVAMAEDTAKISDRRQTVSDLYVGINSVFLTGIGFVAVASHLTTWWATAISGAITAITFLFNFTWIQLIQRYRALINVRVRYLEALEKSLQADGTFGTIVMASEDRKQAHEQRRGVYSLEGATLYKKGSKVGFYRLERRFIIIFMFAYVVLTAAIAGLTYLILIRVLPPLSLST